MYAADTARGKYGNPRQPREHERRRDSSRTVRALNDRGPEVAARYLAYASASQKTFEIRASGRLWGYGTTFEQYQQKMAEPSRGIYRVYTHTDGCFVPPADEPQGVAVIDPPVRKTPGAAVKDVSAGPLRVGCARDHIGAGLVWQGGLARSPRRCED